MWNNLILEHWWKLAVENLGIPLLPSLFKLFAYNRVEIINVIFRDIFLYLSGSEVYRCRSSVVWFVFHTLGILVCTSDEWVNIEKFRKINLLKSSKSKINLILEYLIIAHNKEAQAIVTTFPFSLPSSYSLPLLHSLSSFRIPSSKWHFSFSEWKLSTILIYISKIGYESSFWIILNVKRV